MAMTREQVYQFEKLKKKGASKYKLYDFQIKANAENRRKEKRRAK